MDIKTKETYSEVYSILDMLGNSYINRLPSSLYKMIKEEKLDEYKPQYNSTILLEQQNVRKEALSIIALFHLNYWCTSNDEKTKLKTLLNKNEEKYQAEIREKYNPDNIFKNRRIDTAANTEVDTVTMVEYKESIFKKFFNKIKSFFIR